MRASRYSWGTVGFPSRRLPRSSGQAVAQELELAVAARLATTPVAAAAAAGAAHQLATDVELRSLPGSQEEPASHVANALAALGMLGALLAGELLRHGAV